MIDLGPDTGLPIEFNQETQELIFRSPLSYPIFKKRGVSDLAAVWMDEPQEPDRQLYYYTLDLTLPEDKDTWQKAGLMYGIVVIPPGQVGKEWVKTSGQYHPPAGSGRPGYPEIYIVVKGKGHFLLQRAVPPYEEVTDIVVVEVEAGEHFIVPPDYGHLQINPSDDTLIFSYTMVSDMGESIYKPFQSKKGAGYYEIVKNGGGSEWIANSCYDNLPTLRFVRASALSPFAKQFSKEAPYSYIAKHLKDFEFLVKPEIFQKEWYF